MDALFPLLKWGHVIGAAAAVSIITWGDLLFQRVALTGDTRATATLGAAIRRRLWFEALVMELTVAFGIGAALTGGFNLLAPWLVGAYVLVVAQAVLGIRFGAVEFTTIIEAAARDDAPEMLRIARSRRRIAWLAVSVLIFVALIGLMVVKPGA
jgi:hypothetical protein